MGDDDRISSLPDELLHGILLHLGSTCAAARTSVLSRRWRYVWSDVPSLVLVEDDEGPPLTSFPDTVDAALDAHAAPTVERLVIGLSVVREADAITSGRAAPWLRFAAERVAGAPTLLVPTKFSSPFLGQELELPACGRVKTITLELRDTWRLRPAPAGVFTALTALTILSGRMDGSELTALVSKRCPCLKDLKLHLTLVDASDVSIRSDTLRSLWFWFSWNSSLIEVIAPRLEKLCAFCVFKARFSVPNLTELVWRGDCANDSHQFVNVRHSLQLLDITWITWDARYTLEPTSQLLLQKFDEVDELKLNIGISKGTTGCESFLNETSKLPKCKTLNISFSQQMCHGLVPSMLHLLRNCSSTKKFCVRLFYCNDDSQRWSCCVSCSCLLAENCKVDDIALSSLEEVKISSCTSSHEELKFVELLSKCNARSLKHLVIDYDERKFQASLESKEICKKICSMYGPNVEVEFYIVGQERRVCFDWRPVKNVISGASVHK